MGSAIGWQIYDPEAGTFIQEGEWTQLEEDLPSAQIGGRAGDDTASARAWTLPCVRLAGDARKTAGSTPVMNRSC